MTGSIDMAAIADEINNLSFLAQQGDAAAMYALATFYEIGIDFDQDIQMYEKLMKDASDRGHLGAKGECYIDGLGCDVDIEKGIALLKECADNGDSYAQ